MNSPGRRAVQDPAVVTVEGALLRYEERKTLVPTMRALADAFRNLVHQPARCGGGQSTWLFSEESDRLTQAK